jgi:hypothetical protein
VQAPQAEAPTHVAAAARKSAHGDARSTASLTHGSSRAATAAAAVAAAGASDGGVVQVGSLGAALRGACQAAQQVTPRQPPAHLQLIQPPLGGKSRRSWLLCDGVHCLGFASTSMAQVTGDCLAQMLQPLCNALTKVKPLM